MSAPLPFSPPQPQPEELSHQTPLRPRNKRARPPISCLECRRKKLKCDRVQPCMQCKKGGREALCTFANGAPPPTSRAGEDINRQPKSGQDTPSQTQSYDHEGGRAGWDPTSHPTSSIPERLYQRPSQDISHASSLGFIHVKGIRSRYLGLGDRMSMLSHFEEAKDYIMKSFGCPSTMDMMTEMTAFQKLTVRKIKSSGSAFSSGGRAALITEMLKSLPRDFSWDILFSTMPYWESLTRVLHIPTFRRECNDIFDVLNAGMEALPPIVRESLVPQLLATLALSARLATGMRLSETDRISEEQIGRCESLIHEWLDDLNGKERSNIHSLQTQTLLLLVRQNNNASSSALWKESGDLVRSAMIMGLHIDPEDYPEFSPFQKEQRRRLWRTVVELDIQFSLAASMPTSLRPSDFQSRDLRNVDDLDLVEGMTEHPAEKEQYVWTDSISQIALGLSLKDRLEAANRIGGNVNLDLEASFLLQRAADLERSLQTLPMPVKSDKGLGSSNVKARGILFARVMLDVFLRRPSLSIYRAIALSLQRNRYPEARKGAIRSSIELLSHLDALDPTVADLNVIKDRDLLNLFHVICKNDIIQAAHYLCFEIQKFSQPTPDEAQSAYSPSEDVTWTKHSLTRIVENTLNSLLQRLGEFGSDLKDVLPLSIVLQSVRSGGTRDEKMALMYRGSERVWKACCAVMPEIKDISVRNPPERPSVQPAEQPLSTSWELPVPAYGDMNMLCMDVDFPDFDVGLNNWGMHQSWI